MARHAADDGGGDPAARRVPRVPSDGETAGPPGGPAARPPDGPPAGPADRPHDEPPAVSRNAPPPASADGAPASADAPPPGSADDAPASADGPPSGPGDDAPAESPTGLAKGTWWAAFRRTGKEFKRDELVDRSAALTYFGVLSIFPALLALMSILGLLGRDRIQPMIDNLGSLAPGPVRDTINSVLEQLQGNQGRAGLALIVGLAIALWSASGYVAAFMRASNAVYDIGEGRPVWKTLPVRFLVTVTVVVLLAAIAVGVVFTGTLARRTGDVLGMGDTAVTVWEIAKWPVILVLFTLIVALLYWASPNARRGFRWVSPGSALAVFLWLVASAGFALYVANFASYDRTYGSMAAVIVFLVWLWISNLAILLGLEFDAELERGRAVETGHPVEEEPYVEPRDTRKL